MAIVNTPVAGFTGTVVGVDFVDGTAETDDTAALEYFRRQGYVIDGVSKPGGDLRDAAVDPASEDFLPPTNAGEADPHGPDVISPEVHASEGVAPVVPGPVEDDLDDQEAAEQAAVTGPERPPASGKGSGINAWRDYADAVGVEHDDDASRDDIIAAVEAAEAGDS